MANGVQHHLASSCCSNNGKSLYFCVLNSGKWQTRKFTRKYACFATIEAGAPKRDLTVGSYLPMKQLHYPLASYISMESSFYIEYSYTHIIPSLGVGRVSFLMVFGGNFVTRKYIALTDLRDSTFYRTIYSSNPIFCFSTETRMLLYL
jgi:hypothetical protein